MMETATQNADSDVDPKTYTALNATDRSDTSKDAVFHGTARRDTVEKILENGWINGAVCTGRYTDDYKRDAANDFQRGSVSAVHILEKMDRSNPKCWVEQVEDGRQIITIYWSFQTFKISLDLRNVLYRFEIDDGEDEDEEDEMPDTDPERTPGEVYETLEEGDKVIWDGKSKPLEVTIGYEAAKEIQADHVDFEPTVWLEGPRGGEKQLRRSERNPDTVTVSSMSMSSRPETASGFKRGEKAD